MDKYTPEKRQYDPFHTLRRRLIQEAPDQVAHSLAVSLGRNFSQLRSLVDHAQTIDEAFVVLETVYRVLGLSETQKSLTSMQLRRSGFYAIRKHLRYLLDIEKTQAGSARVLCTEQGIYFPEIFEPGILKNFPKHNDGPCDLYVRFPIGLHSEEDLSDPTSDRLAYERAPTPWNTRARPPIRADFQRRGGSLPLGIVEIHHASEIPDKLKVYAGRAKTLVFDGHGDGYAMNVSTHPNSQPENLDTNNLSSPTYSPLFEALASRGVRVVLFSCILGVEGGLGEDIYRETSAPTYASREVVSRLTIDIDPPLAQYVQFWIYTPNRGGIRPAHTRIIR